jgi:glycosyltransferase involved in cell wall biosynthesis
VNSNFKISIITVSFNSVITIRDSIESIISQDYNNIEYIIIDAGSNDGTLDIINEYKEHISCFISESDKGIYDGMNKGIAAATGDIIGILNSDDFYPNSFVISNVASTFEKQRCDAVYGDLVYVKFFDIDKIIRYWQSGEYTVKKIKNGWMLPHPTFFVKKQLYEKHGYYNTNLKIAADYEMILKLLYKHNIKVFYIPMILVNMRMGGASNSSILNRIRANKEDGLAWTKNQLNKPIFVRIKKPLQKVKQFFLRPKL